MWMLFNSKSRPHQLHKAGIRELSLDPFEIENRRLSIAKFHFLEMSQLYFCPHCSLVTTQNSKMPAIRESHRIVSCSVYSLPIELS